MKWRPPLPPLFSGFSKDEAKPDGTHSALRRQTVCHQFADGSSHLVFSFWGQQIMFNLDGEPFKFYPYFDMGMLVGGSPPRLQELYLEARDCPAPLLLRLCGCSLLAFDPLVTEQLQRWLGPTGHGEVARLRLDLKPAAISKFINPQWDKLASVVQLLDLKDDVGGNVALDFYYYTVAKVDYRWAPPYQPVCPPPSGPWGQPHTAPPPLQYHVAEHEAEHPCLSDAPVGAGSAPAGGRGSPPHVHAQEHPCSHEQAAKAGGDRPGHHSKEHKGTSRVKRWAESLRRHASSHHGGATSGRSPLLANAAAALPPPGRGVGDGGAGWDRCPPGIAPSHGHGSSSPPSSLPPPPPSASLLAAASLPGPCRHFHRRITHGSKAALCAGDGHEVLATGSYANFVATSCHGGAARRAGDSGEPGNPGDDCARGDAGDAHSSGDPDRYGYYEVEVLSAGGGVLNVGWAAWPCGAVESHFDDEVGGDVFSFAYSVGTDRLLHHGVARPAGYSPQGTAQGGCSVGESSAEADSLSQQPARSSGLTSGCPSVEGIDAVCSGALTAAPPRLRRGLVIGCVLDRHEGACGYYLDGTWQGWEWVGCLRGDMAWVPALTMAMYVRCRVRFQDDSATRVPPVADVVGRGGADLGGTRNRKVAAAGIHPHRQAGSLAGEGRSDGGGGNHGALPPPSAPLAWGCCGAPGRGTSHGQLDSSSLPRRLVNRITATLASDQGAVLASPRPSSSLPPRPASSQPLPSPATKDAAGAARRQLVAAVVDNAMTALGVAREALTRLVDADGRNVLHHACDVGSRDLVHYLAEQAPARRMLALLKAKDNLLHLTPLHLVCWGGHTDLLSALAQWAEDVRWPMTEAGGRADMRTGQGSQATGTEDSSDTADPPSSRLAGAAATGGAVLTKADGSRDLFSSLLLALDWEDATLLHYASASVGGSDPSMVRFLLAHGLCASAQELSQGLTPLHLAFINGHMAAAEQLVDASNEGGGDGGAALLEIATRRRHIKPAIYAAHCGQLALLQRFWERSPRIDLSSRFWNHWLPLHVAATNGELSLVRWLVQGPPQVPVDATDGTGATPLIRAALKGQEATVRFLLACGADPDRRDNMGNTALAAATQGFSGGRQGVVAALLEAGADPASRDEDGCSALQLACRYRQMEMLELMLAAMLRSCGEGKHASKGEDDGRGANGSAALPVIPASVVALVNEADVAEAGRSYAFSLPYTPLHAAAEAGHAPCVRLLLALGARSAVADPAGVTPLCLAVGCLVGHHRPLVCVTWEDSHLEAIVVLARAGGAGPPCRLAGDDRSSGNSGQLSGAEPAATPSLVHFGVVAGNADALLVLALLSEERRRWQGHAPLSPPLDARRDGPAPEPLPHHPLAPVEGIGAWATGSGGQAHPALPHGEVDLLASHPYKEWTPLMLAVAFGRKDVVALMEVGAVPAGQDMAFSKLMREGADKETGPGVGAVHLAALAGDPKVLLWLLLGGKPERELASVHHKLTASHVSMLKTVANLRSAKFGNQGPLHLAVAAGHTRVAELLLFLGATAASSGVEGGTQPQQTPLDIACERADFALVRLLLGDDRRRPIPPALLPLAGPHELNPFESKAVAIIQRWYVLADTFSIRVPQVAGDSSDPAHTFPQDIRLPGLPRAGSWSSLPHDKSSSKLRKNSTALYYAASTSLADGETGGSARQHRSPCCAGASDGTPCPFSGSKSALLVAAGCSRGVAAAWASHAGGPSPGAGEQGAGEHQGPLGDPLAPVDEGERPRIDLCRLLLRVGADANIAVKGRTAAQAALVAGHVATARFLVEEGGASLGVPGSEFVNALLTSDTVESLRYLLQAHVLAPNHWLDDRNRPLLWCAVNRGATRCVSLLLKSGVNAPALMSPAPEEIVRRRAPAPLRGNISLLTLACLQGRASILDLLLSEYPGTLGARKHDLRPPPSPQEPSDAPPVSYNPDTPLHHAVLASADECVRVLLAHGGAVGAGVHVISPTNGMKPLSTAASIGAAKIISLLARAGAQVDASIQDPAGGAHSRTPLQLAVARGHMAAVVALVLGKDGAQEGSGSPPGREVTKGAEDVVVAGGTKGEEELLPSPRDGGVWSLGGGSNPRGGTWPRQGGAKTLPMRAASLWRAPLRRWRWKIAGPTEERQDMPGAALGMAVARAGGHLWCFGGCPLIHPPYEVANDRLSVGAQLLHQMVGAGRRLDLSPSQEGLWRVPEGVLEFWGVKSLDIKWERVAPAMKAEQVAVVEAEVAAARPTEATGAPAAAKEKGRDMLAGISSLFSGGSVSSRAASARSRDPPGGKPEPTPPAPVGTAPQPPPVFWANFVRLDGDDLLLLGCSGGGQELGPAEMQKWGETGDELPEDWEFFPGRLVAKAEVWLFLTLEKRWVEISPQGDAPPGYALTGTATLNERGEVWIIGPGCLDDHAFILHTREGSNGPHSCAGAMWRWERRPCSLTTCAPLALARSAHSAGMRDDGRRLLLLGGVAAPPAALLCLSHTDAGDVHVPAASSAARDICRFPAASGMLWQPSAWDAVARAGLAALRWHLDCIELDTYTGDARVLAQVGTPGAGVGAALHAAAVLHDRWLCVVGGVYVDDCPAHRGLPAIARFEGVRVLDVDSGQWVRQVASSSTQVLHGALALSGSASMVSLRKEWGDRESPQLVTLAAVDTLEQELRGGHAGAASTGVSDESRRTTRVMGVELAPAGDLPDNSPLGKFVASWQFADVVLRLEAHPATPLEGAVEGSARVWEAHADVPAHRVILYQRSSFFQRLLDGVDALPASSVAESAPPGSTDPSCAPDKAMGEVAPVTNASGAIPPSSPSHTSPPLPVVLLSAMYFAPFPPHVGVLRALLRFLYTGECCVTDADRAEEPADTPCRCCPSRAQVAHLADCSVPSALEGPPPIHDQVDANCLRRRVLLLASHVAPEHLTRLAQCLVGGDDLAQNTLWDDLCPAYDDAGSFPDLSVAVASGVSKLCHRVILAAGSPYFAGLLQYDMEGPETHKARGGSADGGGTQQGPMVELPLLRYDAEVVEVVLKELYKRPLYIRPPLAVDVLLLADLCTLPRLRRLCLQTLLDHVTSESAMSALEIGLMFHDETLVARCVAVVSSVRAPEEYERLRSDVVAQFGSETAMLEALDRRRQRVVQHLD
eukprot:jgi/Mesvir1/6043/Mv00780-RA.1